LGKRCYLFILLVTPFLPLLFNSFAKFKFILCLKNLKKLQKKFKILKNPKKFQNFKKSKKISFGNIVFL